MKINLPAEPVDGYKIISYLADSLYVHRYEFRWDDAGKTWTCVIDDEDTRISAYSYIWTSMQEVISRSGWKATKEEAFADFLEYCAQKRRDLLNGLSDLFSLESEAYAHMRDLR